jgi:hypothetical protein
MSQLVGRLSALNHFSEVQDLKAGMDFRLPEYRREVFLRFYEFHTKRSLHPGCVYYAFPWLSIHEGWDEEQKLWFAYINGNTQNPVTSWIIFQRYPHPMVFFQGKGRDWFNENWKRLEWDMDRRYQKKSFPDNVNWYTMLTNKGQLDFFKKVCYTRSEEKNFDILWDHVRNNFPTFGRLSAFSYIEYLKIMGVPVDCSQLFLEDISGSASHRNGLAILLGREDLDFHKETPKYSPAQMAWLNEEATLLRMEARKRVPEASYFTIESALCTYKSWHRKDRRYPNVYNDMFYERIKRAEESWPEIDFSIFWEMREDSVHPYLLQEMNPAYPGLDKTTQNWYRQTGQVILMDLDWECFTNDFVHNYASYKNRPDMRQVATANSPG